MLCPQLLTEPGRLLSTATTTPGRFWEMILLRRAEPPRHYQPYARAMRGRDTGQGSKACRWLGRRETLRERRDQDGGRRGLHEHNLPLCTGAWGSTCGLQVTGHAPANNNPHPTTKPTARSSTGKHNRAHAHPRWLRRSQRGINTQSASWAPCSPDMKPVSSPGVGVCCEWAARLSTPFETLRRNTSP